MFFLLTQIYLLNSVGGCKTFSEISNLLENEKSKPMPPDTRRSASKVCRSQGYCCQAAEVAISTRKAAASSDVVIAPANALRRTPHSQIENLARAIYRKLGTPAARFQPLCDLRATAVAPGCAMVLGHLGDHGGAGAI